jgi:hypothetical protein
MTPRHDDRLEVLADHLRAIRRTPPAYLLSAEGGSWRRLTAEEIKALVDRIWNEEEGP